MEIILRFMKMVNRKLTYKIVAVMVLVLLLLIVGSLLTVRFWGRNVKIADAKSAKSYKYHIAFIHTDENINFWDSVYEGALLRGEAGESYVQNFDENLTAKYSSQKLMQIAIDAQVDGIIIDGTDDEETRQLIGKASEAGIPVVTVMEDCPDSERICYVGLSSYTIGRQYGEQLIEHVPSSHSQSFSVDVILNADYSNSGQALVVSGISDYFKENGYGDQLRIETVYIDNNSTFGAEECIRNIFLGDDYPDAIVGMNSEYTRCLFQSAVDLNQVGEVYLYGMGNDDDILDAVSKNIIEATISANSKQMGEAAVSAVEEYLNMGIVSEYMSQDTKLIDAQQAQKLLSENEKGIEKNK